jgi:hypothetical protein
VCDPGLRVGFASNSIAVAERLSPVFPTLLARLAACFSKRRPLFKRLIAKRLTKSLTNLSPHRSAVVSVAERLSPILPAFLARLAACVSYRRPLFDRRIAERLTKRFANLGPNRSPVVSIAVAECVSPIVPTFLARRAACCS